MLVKDTIAKEILIKSKSQSLLRRIREVLFIIVLTGMRNLKTAFLGYDGLVFSKERSHAIFVSGEIKKGVVKIMLCIFI